MIYWESHTASWPCWLTTFFFLCFQQGLQFLMYSVVTLNFDVGRRISALSAEWQNFLRWRTIQKTQWYVLSRQTTYPERSIYRGKYYSISIISKDSFFLQTQSRDCQHLYFSLLLFINFYRIITNKFTVSKYLHFASLTKGTDSILSMSTLLIHSDFYFMHTLSN